MDQIIHGILQITWLFLSKTISGLERPETIPRENRKGEKNTSDFNDNGSNLNEVSADGSSNSNEEPNNSDGIQAGTQQMSTYLVSYGQ